MRHLRSGSTATFHGSAPLAAASTRWLVLFAILGLAWSRPAAAVPFRPDVLASLQAAGRIPAIVAADQGARARGLDAPPPTARGWTVAASDGRVIPDRQAVVILVDFSDKPANQAAYPSSHYSGMLFTVNSYPGGSMRDWYLENSYGQFNVTGAVTLWLRMPQTYAYYVNGQAGFGGYPQNAQKLAEDAVIAADPFVDFSQFDNDGPDGIPDSGDDDGFVDALFIVHAGPGRETTGSDNDIHSHAWAMVNAQVVDGVTANGYSMEPEDGQRGVFGHEFGHVLGLPDLYDTDYSSSGVGDWCMMSFGSWGGGGLTPVHFLSWCKNRLGFLDATVPLTNLPATSIPQVETNPVAYQLWTGGYPERQYFMVENRQRVGSDVSLPGDGIMISHIDETVSGNSDENHMLVAIEQADGLFQLEHGQGSNAGDPWPGTSVNRNFTDTSTPNSRDYANAPTQVAVRNIGNSSPATTVDLEVENQPIFSIDSWSITEVNGNGDGNIDPAETWDLPVTVRNRGTTATSVTGSALTLHPSVIVLNGATSFGTIASEMTAPGVPAFRFRLAGSATTDAVPIDLQVHDLAGHSVNLSLIVGINDPLQMFNWTHGNATPGYLDQWHVSTQRNHSPGGSYSWKCGGAGGSNYADRDDATLYTPPVPLATTSAVHFWHWISAENDANQTAWDGGVVEASVDGGPWTLIQPDGGYPYTIIPNPDSPFPGGMPCYSGTADWAFARFDLSGLSGTSVQLRFRFGSDGAVTFEGWYIDDLAVEGTAADVNPGELAGNALFLGAARPNPAAGPVRMDCRAPRGVPATLSVFDLGGRCLYTRPLAHSGDDAVVVTWNGLAADGTRLPSGVYFLRLEAGGQERVQRVHLVR